MISQKETTGAIDRVSPTLRPRGRIAMRQHWAELLFLHWAVPAEQIQGMLPPGLEVDTYEGRAYVGLVPFTMTGVRPPWAPSVRGLSDFHETNVRTYVHRGGRDPGVWFFSLDAANATAVRIARSLWKLPYHYARMQLKKEVGQQDSHPFGAATSCVTERLWPGPTPACCQVRYTPARTVAYADVGSLEHFLVERYILYAHGNGGLYMGRVHHAPYPLQPATVHSLNENMISAAGIDRPDAAPLAHYAREVDVHVFPLRQVKA